MGAEGGPLTHELLLCTRHRPETVRECLAHVLASTAVPDRILVVDSSDDDLTAHVCRDVAAAAGADGPAGVVIEHHRHAPGLTAQRNGALRLAKADIVHFIDDDAMVVPEYFASILAAFEELGDRVVGVAGRQHDSHWRSRRRARRFFALTGDPGTVTRAAVNTPPDITVTSLQPIDWMAGGCMSMRREAALETWFDEGLLGYGLGEDLEFSLRLRQHGELWFAPGAVIDHREAPGERPAIRARARDEVLLRDMLVRRHPDRFSAAAFWWSVLGLLLILPARAVLKWTPISFVQWQGVVQGTLLLLRGQRRPAQFVPPTPPTPLTRSSAG